MGPVAIRRIELVDPSPEGQRVAEALRAHGLYVLERSFESLREGTAAAVVIIASDAPSADEALKAMRAAGRSDVPLILLGDRTSSGALVHESIGAVPADRVFPRPIAVDRLIRKVEAIFSPSSELSDSRPLGPPERTMSFPQESSISDWKPPERTLELPAEEEAPKPAPPPPQLRPPSLPPPPSGTIPRIPSTSAGDDDTLSPRLRKLMLEADRRVFPSAAPIELRFAVSDLPVHEIVPDELLDAVSLPIDPVEDDPLDAFTYMGPAPDHTSQPSIPEASRPPWVTLPPDIVEAPSDESSLTSAESPGTFAGRRAAEVKSAPAPVRELPFGEPAQRGRRGPLGDGDVVRLLLDVALESRDGRIEITTPRGALVLRVDEGDVVAFEAPVHVGVAARLAREGRLGAAPQSETEATAALEALVTARLLGRLELERALREERERWLAQIVAEQSGQFYFEPGVRGDLGAPLLSRPLGAAVLEAARRGLDLTRARRLLGLASQGRAPEPRLAFRLDAVAPRIFRRLGVEPELARLLSSGEGEDLDGWIGYTGEPDGIAAAIFVLVCAGAARLGPAMGARELDPIDAARAAVLAAAELAEDGDYFAILGVRSDAHPRELREAHATRRQSLMALRFPTTSTLDALEAARREALEAVDEAFEVLADERRRAAYRSALGA